MSRPNVVEGVLEETKQWRQHLHTIPEIGLEETETSAFIVSQLEEIGVDEIHDGIAKTGIVAVIKGQKHTACKAVGLRADIDALPITETTDHPYKSQREGVMHACGHDGHSALLLGAAKVLTETRNFDGIVYLIFQPAEENFGGGDLMVKEGLFDRFQMDAIYGLHNAPGIPVNEFHIRSGTIMASTDEIHIDIETPGGHAAMPHETIDPVVIGAQIILALQLLVSRETDVNDPAVISITQLKGSDASNVIPSKVTMIGTLRALSKPTRERLRQRIEQVAIGTAQTMGATANCVLEAGYPPTINDPEHAKFAADVARSVTGVAVSNPECQPIMGAEDFSYMLEKKPGAYIFLGNGDTTDCHTPTYDFNDDAIPFGVEYWVKLAEAALPIEG